jgi:hypothetical protein
VASLTEGLVRFRKLKPLPQALVVGAIFLALYWPFLLWARGLGPMDAAYESLASAALFASVYYLTSVVLLRKSIQQRQTGPRKGMRRP